MTIQLAELPYPITALAPHFSRETLEYHYGKHHRAYVDNLNRLITNTAFAEQSLESIVCTASDVIFNNAAQVYNHDFYWQCLSPNGGGQPTGTLLASINASFGDFSKFKEQFTAACLSLFGSGWVWLVQELSGNLTILPTNNANTPLTANKQPLLTCDVWEHAYYIDYRNIRAKYLEAFWQVVNWQFVASKMND